MSHLLQLTTTQSSGNNTSTPSLQKLQQFYKKSQKKLLSNNQSVIFNGKQISLTRLVGLSQLPQFGMLVTFNYSYGQNLTIKIDALKNGQFFKFRNIHRATKVRDFINTISIHELGSFNVHSEKRTLSLRFGSAIDEGYFKKHIVSYVQKINAMIQQWVEKMSYHLYIFLQIGGQIDSKTVQDIKKRGVNIFMIDNTRKERIYKGILKKDIPLLQDSEKLIATFKRLKLNPKSTQENGQKINNQAPTQTRSQNKTLIIDPIVLEYLLKYKNSLQHKEYQRPSYNIYHSSNIRERLENYVYVQCQEFQRTNTSSLTNGSTVTRQQQNNKWAVIFQQPQSIISRTTCKIRQIMGVNQIPRPITSAIFTQRPIQRLLIKKQYVGPQAEKRASRQNNILKLFLETSSDFIPKYYSPIEDKGDNSIYLNYYKQKSGLSYFGSRSTNSTKLHFLKSAIQGLRLLKDKKIVHTDIKLQNILISRNLGVKISDFGEAISIDTRSNGQIVKFTNRFTLPFAASQAYQYATQQSHNQLNSNKSNYSKDTLSQITTHCITNSFDTYSFGVMTHQLLTQYYILPYRKGKDHSFVQKIIRKKEYPKHLIFSLEKYVSMFGDKIGQLMLMLVLISMHPEKEKRCNQEMLNILLVKIVRMDRVFGNQDDEKG